MQSRALITQDAGTFSEFDRAALTWLLEQLDSGRPLRVAEIGSWLGDGSTLTIGRMLAEREGGGELYCVDHWRGSPNVPDQQDLARESDVFGTFLRNVRQAGLEHVVHPLIMSSADASKVLADGSFDLVFIDADHSYAAVRGDIDRWRAKVRPGGILCGHDCEGRVEQFGRRLLQTQRDSDLADVDGDAAQVHGGVILAVDEMLGRAANLFVHGELELADGRTGRSTIWWTVVGPASTGRVPAPLVEGYSPPRLLRENYRGFNLIAFRDAFLALAQTVGPVTIESLDEVALVRLELGRDVLRAASLEQAMQAVDDRTTRHYTAETLIHNYLGYCLVRFEGEYFAVAQVVRRQGLRTLDRQTFRTLQADERCFAGRSLEAVQQLVRAHRPKLIRENYRTFNLLRFRGEYFGLHRLIGNLNLAMLDPDTADWLESEGKLVRAETLPELRRKVAAVAPRIPSIARRAAGAVWRWLTTGRLRRITG